MMLNRRQFLIQGGTFSAAALCPLLTSTGGTVNQVRWILKDKISPGLPFLSNHIDQFISEIHRQSGGRFLIERRVATLDEAYRNDQQEDLQLGAAFRRENSIPGSMMFSYVPYGLGLAAYQHWLSNEGLKHWQGLYSAYGNFTVFPFGKFSQVKGVWSHREILGTRDLVGAKVLSMGLSGEVFKILRARVDESQDAVRNFSAKFNARDLDIVQWGGGKTETDFGLASSGARFYHFGSKGEETGSSCIEATVRLDSLSRLSDENKKILISALRIADRSVTKHAIELSRFDYKDSVVLSESVQQSFRQARSVIFDRISNAGTIQSQIVASYKRLLA